MLPSPANPIFLLSCPNTRYTKLILILEVFYRGLSNHCCTHALTSFTVIEPSVKRTHDAVRVDHLPSHSQIGSHMHAIGRQCIELLVGSPINHDIVTIDIDSFDSFFGNLFGSSYIVPSVGVRWRRVSHVLLFDIKLALNEEQRGAKLEVIYEIEHRHCERKGDSSEPLMLINLDESFTK